MGLTCFFKPPGAAGGIPESFLFRVVVGFPMNGKPVNADIMDQYVLWLVGMDHADTERMPDNSVRGKTWLQKMLHVASESVGREQFGFVPFKYGAYSQAVNESVERCSRAGLLCIHRADRDCAIHITRKGKEKLDISKCNPDMLRQMQSTKSLLNNLDYREMIVYSYALFPDMTKHIDIEDKFESWREDAAVSMYLKGAVSLALAADISGLARDDFEDHLRRGGIEPHSPLVRTDVVIPVDVPSF